MKLLLVLFCFSIQLIFTFGDSVSDIKALHLKCEYLNNPLAVNIPEPRLSWELETTDTAKQNLSQKAYQILVATDKHSLDSNIGNLWDTNKVVSDRNIHIKYKGVQQKSGQRYYWKVMVWDQNDKPSQYSTVEFWDKGLAINDWTAEWIGAPKDTQHKALQNLSSIDSNLIKSKPGLVPVLYMRKNFTTDSKVKSAKLYATAQGAYKIHVNGKLISDSELSPGWTDYKKTIQYQTYDVSHLISKENAIGAQVGTGWYSSYVGFLRTFNNYGSDQYLFIELHIEYENDKKIVIKTDNSWRVTTGPIIYSDLLMGELYYEDRELKDWSSAKYDDKNWLSVVTKPIDKNVNLVADRAQPVRVVQELKPKSKYQSKPGVWVFDFEQNMVGWVQLKFNSEKSARVQLRHAEVLDPNGSIYVLNLRSALATDTYVFTDKSHSTQVFEPHFTFHGFRYVEVTGYPGEPKLEDIVGRVVHSDTPLSGHFETSNQMVNKLRQNIVWGQRGNFLSVPTDCPQRDERLGWMGDAEIFAHTAAYNAEVNAFYGKWMTDLRDAQSAQGGYSDVSPRLVDPIDGSPAWGDAGVIIPYTVWRMYGDIDIIEENYVSMKRWIDYILSENPNYIWTKRVNNNFGDWLSVNSNTPKEVLSTAYFGYDCLLLAKMAKAINQSNDVQKYLKLHTDIANAFNNAFVNQTDGKIKGDSQTVYLVALAFELLPDKLRPLAAQHLADNIKAHDWHLTTGFVGVGYLCPTLTQFGHNDVAYRILLQDTYPSWGYSIKYNATTIWERWDGWTKDKGFQTPDMNSFNHYSLGSIGRWLFQSVAGIDTDEEMVGFKKILIKPNPGNGLTFVNSYYKSINGLIVSSWTLSANDFKLNVSIPVNTRASVDLRFTKNGAIHDVGSGSYQFEIKL